MSNKTYRFLNPYSSVKGKKPSADTMYFGEIYVNGNADEPRLYIKNTNNEVVSFTPIEVSSALTSGDTNPVEGGAIYNAFVENELVVANALNALNAKKLDASAYTPTSSATEIANALAEKLDIDDFDAYSATVYTKNETSGATELSTEFAKYYLKNETSSKTEIDDALALKLDISDFNVYSGAVDTKFSDYYTTAQTSSSTEIATALNGKVNTSNVTSAVTINSTDVLTSGGAYAQFGGLKLVKLTQAQYDALSPNYDANTIYYIVN